MFIIKPYEFYHYWYLVYLLFWTIIIIVNFWSIFTMAMASVFAFYLQAIYLKYRFKQINRKLNGSFDSRYKIIKLIRLFTQHSKCCKLVHKLNIPCAIILGSVYFGVGLLFDLVLFVTVTESFPFYIRIMTLIGAIIATIVLYLITFFASLIGNQAHKPYNKSFSILVKNKMPIKVKLELINFIELLSGPRIGFYCFDLFPMTNNQFYQYAVGIAMNFILIYSLFK